jgi:hypothetical protein
VPLQNTYVTLMPKIVRIALLAFLVLSSSVGKLSADEETPWGDLSGWVGKYPTDRQPSGTRSLLGVPPLHAALQALLDRNDLERLVSGYRVESQIDRVDHYLLVQICKAHDCPDNNAMVVIDEKDKRLWIGFFSRAEQGISTRWYGTDDYVVLPKEILARFQQEHGG